MNDTNAAAAVAATDDDDDESTDTVRILRATRNVCKKNARRLWV